MCRFLPEGSFYIFFFFFLLSVWGVEIAFGNDSQINT